MTTAKSSGQRIELSDLEWEDAIRRAQSEADTKLLVYLLRDSGRAIPEGARSFVADLIEGRAKLPKKRGRKARLSQGAIDFIRLMAETIKEFPEAERRRSGVLKKVDLEEFIANYYQVSVATVREILAKRPRRRYAANGRN